MAKKRKKSAVSIGAAPNGEPTSAPAEKNSKKKIVIIAVSALLAVALIMGILLSILPEGDVDFMNDDLSDYITISKEDYSSFDYSGQLREYTESDLTERIRRILAENKSKDAYNGGLGATKIPLSIGDEAEIYYRGYIVSDGVEQQSFDASSNFSGEAVTIEIGSGKVIGKTPTTYFIPGFEAALEGVIPGNYASFKKLKSGAIKKNYVVYLSYYSFSEDENKSVMYERLDLKSEGIDEKYGEGFLEFLIGGENSSPMELGKETKSIDFKKNGKTVTYSNFVANFATDGCEDNPLTIDVVFPDNYTEPTLRGKAAKFDVYISHAIIYDAPTALTDAFIKDTLKFTDERLSSYEGADLVEKYKSYLCEQIKEEIREENYSLIEEAMWKHYLEKVVVDELPSSEVDKIYESTYNEIVAYQSYLASQSTTGSTTLDLAATLYLELPTGSDWRAHIIKDAEEKITKKLVFYYVIREEGFVPDSSEIQALKDKLFGEILDYNLNLNSADLATLEGDAYDAYVSDLKADILEYYGEAYFEENAVYEFAIKMIIENFAKLK